MSDSLIIKNEVDMINNGYSFLDAFDTWEDKTIDTNDLFSSKAEKKYYISEERKKDGYWSWWKKGGEYEKVKKDIFWNGFLELRKVWNQLDELPNLKKFLPAFFVYSTALQTVILIAAYFGEQEIMWTSSQQKTIGLIVSIMLIQIVAIFGAYATAAASKRFGNISTLVVVNFIWALLCVFAFFIKSPMEFYIAAAGVGLVVGGIQALSRSTYSKFIPKTKDTTSFFSFYDVTEKIGIIVGMVMFGSIDQITGSMRNALLFFIILFFTGALLLSRIPNNHKGN